MQKFGRPTCSGRMLGSSAHAARRSYILATRQGIAVLLCEQDAWVEAERVLRDLLDDERRVLGADNRISLTTGFNLAQAMRHQGRRAEARATIRALLEDARRMQLGEDHFLTATIREFREGVLLSSSSFSTLDLRREVAEDMLNKAVAFARQPGSVQAATEAYQQLAERFGDDPWPDIREFAASALLHKGVALGAMDRMQSAEAFQQVADRFDEDPSPRIRELVAKALNNKAIMLDALEHSEEAVLSIERAIGIYEELAQADPNAPQVGLESAREELTRIKENAAVRLFNEAVALAQQAGSQQAAAVAFQRMADRFDEDPSPRIRELVAKALNNKAIMLDEQNPTQSRPPGPEAG
jgi:tetratricopeptide (TPR) repeat protein